MPIFQADLEQGRERRCSVDSEASPIAIDQPASSLRRLSEESLPTELCEGPVPDSPAHSHLQNVENDTDDAPTSNRAELIQRLKRGESPTWIPNRLVRVWTVNVPLWPCTSANLKFQLDSLFPADQHTDDKPRPSRTSSGSSSLLPAAQITPEKKEPTSPIDTRLCDGQSIERPRSALHSGDFTNEESPEEHRIGERDSLHRHLDRPWMGTSPPRDFTPFHFDEARRSLSDVPFGSRSRSYGTSPLSSSFSSSFAYQPPTSPLVQSESNDELELPEPLDTIDFPSGRLSSRRHTLYSTSSFPSISPSFRTHMSARVPSHRRENSLPYQAHQPRRSLTSTPSFLHNGLGSSPQPQAMLRSRRPSIGSDSSPLHHASMVGSYEESILRGRMSTTPSKPLDFLAQIGVLGIGKCKSSLRCPPHVTLSFPAVYYSYSSTPHGRSRTDDGPSPYVGQIDLENGLPNQADDSRSRRKAQSRYGDRAPLDADGDAHLPNQPSEGDCRWSSRPKRRSGSPRAPPGGSYRIPEKGQIQIIIKNQNKTAVKLFLVPYDLAGMEPGTKTFIRQKSYSAGPVIDGVPKSSGLDPLDRPILRYLLHMHICSPSRGRYYLYKSIRIVFANRVPDGKEKLTNETTSPEPRFTPYKPIRVMHPPLSISSGAGATLTAEKAFRRRSSGFMFGRTPQAYDAMDGMCTPEPHRQLSPSNEAVDITTPPERIGSGDNFGYDGVGASSGSGNILPLEPIPFRLPGLRRRPSSSNASGGTSTTLAASGFLPTEELSSPPTHRQSQVDWYSSNGADSWESGNQYAKLNKGDLGYGGNAFSSPTSVASGSGSGGAATAAEGLLSKRLRSLGVKAPLGSSPPSTSAAASAAVGSGAQQQAEDQDVQ